MTTPSDLCLEFLKPRTTFQTVRRIFLSPRFQEKYLLLVEGRLEFTLWSQVGWKANQQQQLDECPYQIFNGWLVFKLKISSSRCWTKCILSAASCCADAHGGIEMWAAVRLTALAMKHRCAWTHCHPPYRYSGLTACCKGASGQPCLLPLTAFCLVTGLFKCTSPIKKVM